jgi:hypothetical protein
VPGLRQQVRERLPQGLPACVAPGENHLARRRDKHTKQEEDEREAEGDVECLEHGGREMIVTLAMIGAANDECRIQNDE